MSYYELAVRVWSAVAALAVIFPMFAVLAYETRKALECVRAASPADSVSSRPAASAPSHHGF